MAKATPRKRRVTPKAGRSKVTAAARRAAFAREYLVNGRNGTAAASAVGYTGSQLANTAWRLLQRADVQAILTARAHEISDLAGMNAANWAYHLSAVAYSFAGDVCGPDGALLPVAKLPRHVQSSIAAIKVRTSAAGDTITEYKRWPKMAALEIMARHLGLLSPAKIEVTGADGGPVKTEDMSMTEIARRIAFVLAAGAHAKPE